MSARLLPHFEGSLLVGLLVNNILNELLWWWSFGWFGGKSPWQMVFASLSLQFVVPSVSPPKNSATSDMELELLIHQSKHIYTTPCQKFHFSSSFALLFHSSPLLLVNSEQLFLSIWDFQVSHIISISWSHCSRVLMFV